MFDSVVPQLRRPHQPETLLQKQKYSTLEYSYRFMMYVFIYAQLYPL